MSSKPKLHLIGNAHLDPVWLWPWTEGFHEAKATFRSALDRMQEYDDERPFIFVASSAAYYEWIEQSDPAMFREIQQRVREGRWGLVGGWWIQPDCNIPCGESFVRQALVGQRYFQEKFGVMATVGYNVDSFGHNGMLPQILLKSGLSNYVFMRPGPSEKGLPGRLFWWEADDGSRVLAFRIPFSYATWGSEMENAVRLTAGEFQPPLDLGMFFYGVGNHGGGPTKENIESLRRLQEQPDFPELVFSTPAAFFAEARAKQFSLPVVHDDLQHHASGCYAAHSGVKRWNRQAENRLMSAEKWSALAWRISGQPYPADFNHAWKNVLFNQFHDIMAGTSIEPAYDDARDLYGESLAIAGRALNLATQAVAWNIRTEFEAGVMPIVVFNPHAWQQHTSVELEISTPQGAVVLLDDQGREIPYQFVQSQSAASGRSRLSFIADLPSLGYRLYRLRQQESVIVPASLQASDTAMENERYRIEFNPQTGCLQSLFDKRLGVELLAGEAARGAVLDDPSDTWSHNVFRFDQEIGSFAAASLRLIENGPVKATIRVASAYGESRLVQDFSLYRDLDQIDVAVTVDWREQYKLLKLRFPFRLGGVKATYEIPYGHIERFANGEENPALNWVDVTGAVSGRAQRYGVSLLNDGKYSYDVQSHDIINVHDVGLTVLRSPAYAHHWPLQIVPGAPYAYMEQGRQSFHYSLLPHTGGWEDAHTVQRAADLNARPVALIGTFHPAGTLPPSEAFVTAEPENVIVSVLKMAEDGEALILRAYETTQRQASAVIRLPRLGRTITAQFGPCEIKTFRLPLDDSLPAAEVNLLEMSE